MEANDNAKTKRGTLETKGILKATARRQSREFVPVATTVSGTHCTRGGRVKWDEEVIAEHDKLRGTRVKIDEPNTPFYVWQDSGEAKDDEGGAYGAVSPAELRYHLEQLRLEAAVHDGEDSTTEEPPLKEEDRDGSCRADEVNENKHKFLSHRRAHYNEFRVLQKLRSQGTLSDSSSEDSDDSNS